MHTNFTLSCENWIDIDAPLSYEFSYQSYGVRIPYFYTTAPIGRKVVFTDWLPVGDQKNDFELTVTVQVKDKFGSKTKQDYTVQVSVMIKKCSKVLSSSPCDEKILNNTTSVLH